MSIRRRLTVLACVPLLAGCGSEGPDEGAEEVGDTTGDGDATGDTDDTTGDADTTGDDTGEEHTIPQFGETFTVIGTADDGLNAVRDLEFNPGAPDQLWTFNTGIHGTVIYFDPGTAQQTSQVRIDAYGQHFMAFVSSAAFGNNGNFASCQESRNEWNVGPQPPDDFMGPT
jgi:hypothetical protein